MAGEYQFHLFKKKTCTSTMVQGFFCSFLDEKYRQQTQTFARVLIRNHHPAIISDELFVAVQHEKIERSKKVINGLEMKMMF